jgi:Protein of unknown function (DUF2370)
VSTRDEDDHVESHPPLVPASPPPPFESRPSSPRDRLLRQHDPMTNEGDEDAERTLADAFDDGSDDEEDLAQDQSTRRLVSGSSEDHGDMASPVERRVIQYPSFAPTTTQVYGTGRTHDGVFSNLMAKPTSGEEADEKPPVRITLSLSHLLTN